MKDIFVVAGLGNPGSRYDNTRHNVGFDVLDLIADEFTISNPKSKFNGLIAEVNIKNSKVILVKPQTYMNLSGECISQVVNWYKISFNNLIVIYDDVDIDEGKIRLRSKGSSGSHNGMKSVIYMLNNDQFPRIRIGVGKPPPNITLADYVLSKIDDNSKEIFAKTTKIASKAAVEIIEHGIDRAMNMYNK